MGALAPQNQQGAATSSGSSEIHISLDILIAIIGGFGSSRWNGYRNIWNRDLDCRVPVPDSRSDARLGELAAPFSHFSHKPPPNPHKTTQLNPT